LTPEELAQWLIKLQDVGNVHNINFVTPEHVVPQVVLAILHAKDLGLRLPIIYNTSSFDSLESIRLLDGLVDIYLPDFKVWTDESSRRYLKANGYADVAKHSIKEMYSQVGDVCFTPDGIAKSGVLVRHLVMPGKEGEGCDIVQWLSENISRDLYVHIMEQYHPDAHVGKPARAGRRDEPYGGGTEKANPNQRRYHEINRPASESEVSQVRRAAEKAGLWRFVAAADHEGFNI
jgi:putative pyruvate formate lyase activating enzyme